MALTIEPGYLRRLIVKVRSFMGKEASELPDEASNPTDDEMPSSALQEEDDDLSREEVVEEIRGLEPRQQAELVALMWLGRDEGDPEEFEDLVKQAMERRARLLCAVRRVAGAAAVVRCVADSPGCSAAACRGPSGSTCSSRLSAISRCSI